MTNVLIRILAAPTLAISLAGCQSEAELAVSNLMKDPGSTVFRNVKRCGGPSDTVTEGEYNSKNSYGAMAGFQRFFYENGKVELGMGGDLFYRCLAQSTLALRASGAKPAWGGNTIDAVITNIMADDGSAEID